MIRKVICKCKNCNNEFSMKKDFTTTEKADYWEKFAKKHFNICPSCYQERLKQERLDRENEIIASGILDFFPTLIGSSKQIEFAGKLILEHLSKLDMESSDILPIAIQCFSMKDQMETAIGIRDRNVREIERATEINGCSISANVEATIKKETANIYRKAWQVRELTKVIQACDIISILYEGKPLARFL